MAEKKMSWGDIGTWFANVTVILTTNWQVAVLAVFAVLSGWWDGLFNFFDSSRVQVGIGVFIASLWTYIGISTLARRTPDYKYGLTFEGLVPFYQPDMPETALGFGIQFRNFSAGPIAYTVDEFDVRIGTRSLPKLPRGALKASFIARGGGRMSSNSLFSQKDIEEFLDKPVTGTVEFSISYGAPKKPPVRRLKMTLSIQLNLKKEGPVGFGTGILEESDEPI